MQEKQTDKEIKKWGGAQERTQAYRLTDKKKDEHTEEEKERGDTLKTNRLIDKEKQTYRYRQNGRRRENIKINRQRVRGQI